MELKEETATIDCTRLLLLTVSLSSNLLQAVRIGKKIITFHRALDIPNCNQNGILKSVIYCLESRCGC